MARFLKTNGKSATDFGRINTLLPFFFFAVAITPRHFMEPLKGKLLLYRKA